MNNKTITAAIASTILSLFSHRLTLSQIPRWQSIGPWGGAVNDIAIAPSQTNVLYAIQGSVIKSTDYGKTWFETGPIKRVNNRPIGFLNRVTVHPDLSNCVYLGGQTTLRRSLDGGQNWEVVIDTLGFDFDKVIFNPQNHRTVYASAFDLTVEDNIYGGGIFKSIDGGKRWKLLETVFPGSSVADFAISSSDTTVLYAVTYQTYPKTALYKSSDAGRNWTQLNIGIEETVFAITLSPSSPATIYANHTDVYTNRYGIIKTTDSGQNWSRVDSNLPPAPIRSFVVDPRDSERVYAAIGGFYFDPEFIRKQAYGLYLTEDGGLSWNRIVSTLEDSLFHDIEIDPLHPDILYLAAEIFGVYTSEDDGKTWQQRNGNMHRISGPFAINPKDINTIYMASSDALLRTLDGGISWKRIFSFKGFNDALTIALAPSKPNMIYVSARNKPRPIWRSQDGGNTWSVCFDSVLPDKPTTFVVDPTRANIVYAFSSKGIYKSIDGAVNWIAKNQGLAAHPVNGLHSVHTLAFNPLNANSVYAATMYGLFKSVDGGENWQRVDSTEVEAVGIAQLDTSIIYTSTPSFLDAFGRLRRSKDGGITWEEVKAPGSAEISNFIIDPQNPHLIWITTINEFIYTSQVFLSADDGANWISFNDGLPSAEIRDIVIPSFKKQRLFALTNPYGLYRLDYSTAVKDRPDRSPSDFQLFQNYPNPFFMPSSGERHANLQPLSSGTVIEYQLAFESHVELTIYNILGEIVTTLVSQKQGPGRHRVRWNGKDSIGRWVPAGIYFVKLAMADASHTRKIVLMH